MSKSQQLLRLDKKRDNLPKYSGQPGKNTTGSRAYTNIEREEVQLFLPFTQQGNQWDQSGVRNSHSPYPHTARLPALNGHHRYLKRLHPCLEEEQFTGCSSFPQDA